MKKSYTLTLFSLVIIVVVMLSGCGRKLSSAASSTGDLKYGFTGNESYSYSQKSSITQSMVFGGQEVVTNVNSELGFTTAGRGISNGSLILEVTVDTLGIYLNAMGTTMNEDIKEMQGKSFMMTMDPKGEDKNLDDAEGMTYTIAGVQTADLKESFMMIFPRLPKEIVQPGYTWEDTDTVNINTETETAEMILSSVNTVEAREVVAGYDCYKVSYTVSGTRDGSSQTPQGLILMNLDISGTGYYYFAIKEGIIVSDNSDLKMDGDIIIPTGDSLPMEMTTKTELKLL
jgi:hypothetical protein